MLHGVTLSHVELNFILSWISSWVEFHLELNFIISWISSWVEFHLLKRISSWVEFQLELNFIMSWNSSWVEFYFVLNFILCWISSWIDFHLELLISIEEFRRQKLASQDCSHCNYDSKYEKGFFYHFFSRPPQGSKPSISVKFTFINFVVDTFLTWVFSSWPWVPLLLHISVASKLGSVFQK
jgi:hypothetical protein